MECNAKHTSVCKKNLETKAAASCSKEPDQGGNRLTNLVRGGVAIGKVFSTSTNVMQWIN
jgi:hypothetical protein